MINNPIFTLKQLLDSQELPEDYDKIWERESVKYIHNSFSYMTKVLNFKEPLIHDIFDYYKECTAMLALNSENISEYRKKLMSIVNDEFIISSSGGYLYKDKNHKQNINKLGTNNIFGYSDGRDILNNFFMFLILQYEEDILIDKLYDDIRLSMIDKRKISASNFSFTKPEYFKSFFNDPFFDKNTSDKEPLYINIEKLHKRYVFKHQVNYIAVGVLNNEKFIIKLKHSVWDSGHVYINDAIEQGNAHIRIVQPAFNWAETLNQKNILVMPPNTWILEKDK